jgi:hypothetical protein
MSSRSALVVADRQKLSKVLSIAVSLGWLCQFLYLPFRASISSMRRLSFLLSGAKNLASLEFASSLAFLAMALLPIRR